MPSVPPSRPKPDCLTPPNGARGVGDDALVEADHAGLEALDDAERALEVARVDVGDEAELGGVGRGDRLVLVGRSRATGATGPKISSLEQARVVGHAGEHGRLVEVARAVDALTADERPWRPCRPRRRRARRPCRAASSSISGPTLTSVVGAAADLAAAPIRCGELARRTRRRRDSCDVEAVGRRARLADVAHLGDHRALDGRVEVGVVEDEERRVAAELHRDAQQLLGATARSASRPTSVEPVKDSLRVRGSSISGS